MQAKENSDITENKATPTAQVYEKSHRQYKKITSIDFNCDLAQSFGIYKNEKELELLNYMSSVNISTGFHAGDPIAIKNALLAAKEKNVVIGAHIGFDDLQGFGNRAVSLTEDEIEALVVYQVGALMSFAKAYNLEIEHVRPHGAMYKLAAENFTFSCSIAKAIKKCSKWLVYYGAAGDVISKVGDFVQLPIAQEIQLDKCYNADGTVDFASEITNTDVSMRRLHNFLRSSQVDNNVRGYTTVQADTIHFSCKSQHAIELARKAHGVITPVPFNYNKVQPSGWV